jgi:autotransporter-associated beta strand protein
MMKRFVTTMIAMVLGVGLLLVGAAKADVPVAVTAVSGHDGGNWPATLGHLSDMVNALDNTIIVTADTDSGMTTSADPVDPATWTYSGGSWPQEWKANSRLVPASSSNNKLGWAMLDFGGVQNTLANIFLWNCRSGSNTENVNTYNIYYAETPTTAMPAMPNSKSVIGDYDFASGGWTQLNGAALTLPQNTANNSLPQATVSLGGVNARYIGIEILTAGNGTGAGRVGLGQVEVTKSDAPTFTPSGPSTTGVANDNVTFNAQLFVDRTNADVRVYWGLTDETTNAGSWANCALVGNFGSAGETNLTVSLATNGLAATTTYYYTFSGSNSTEVKWIEPSASFLSGGTIVIENDGSSPENQYATISGDLQSDNGAATTVHVYWGTTDGGTTAANWANTNVLSGTQPVGALSSDTTSGLLYGVQYYFRYYATNATGEAWASSSSGFVTGLPSPAPPTANLEAWYDAGYGVSPTSGTVTNWLDRSGNGRHLVPFEGSPTLAANEINGLPAMYFDADNENLQQVSPVSEYFAKETWLAFRSGQNNTFRGWGAPFGAFRTGDSNDRHWMFENNTAKFWSSELPASANYNGSDVSSANNFDIADNGANSMSEFMVLRVVTGPNSGTHVRPYVVGTENYDWSAGRYYTAEILTYNSENSAGDREDIGGYLAAKYGITTTYPVWTIFTNAPVSAITDTSATYNAGFRGTASVYDLYVYSGTTDGGSDVSSWGKTNFIGSYTNANLTQLSFNDTTLVSGTQYYYRFSAQNAATNLWATPSETFQTIGTPAANTAGGATKIRSGAAQLNGALSAGSVADIYFCWGYVNGGTGGGPGNWQNVEAPVGAYLTEPVSADISGTLYGLTYYYACYASNAFGTAWSTVSTFTTLRPIPMLVTSGLEGWYSADYGVTTSGDNVTSWLDRSVNGNNSTGVTGAPTLANDDVNFWPAVHFRGGNNHLDLGPIVPREEYIVFRSGRYAYNAGDPHKWGPDWGGPFGQQNNNGWMLENNQTRTWTSGANVPLAMVQNGTDLPNVGNAFYMSNVGDYFILKASPQQYGSANGVLGRPNNSWGNGNIDLAEILVFNTTLSTEDEDKVGGYLAQKYGITSTYPLLPIPGLENTGVTGIFLDQAILNGSYLGTQSVFDVWVYLNTSDGVQSKAAWLAGSGASYYMGSFTNTDAVLAQPVSGLTGSTTYYYNYYASNVVEEIWGDSVVFGSAGPPTVENRGITNATSTAATLQGELTIGGKAVITLCWGTTDAGTAGGTAAWQNAIPLGTNDAGNVFSTTISDVYYGVNYYYRTYATNGLGDDWSDTATGFTTLQPEGDVTELPVTANLEGWYSADAGLSLSGNNVTQWDDRSGNNRHSTSVVGTPELSTGEANGKPAIKFRGENFSVNHAMVPREEYIVFRSGRHDSDVNPHLWYADWSGPVGQQNNSGWMLENNQRRTWNSNVALAMKQNGTNLTKVSNQYYMNDVGDYMVLKVNPVNYPSANMFLGRSNNSWGNGHVDVAEIIIFSDTKSAGDEDAIGSYLAWKYGIQTTYPAFTPPNGSTIVNQLVSGIAPAQAQLNASLSSSQAVHDVWAFWSTNDYGTSKANWQADGSSAFVGQFTNAVTDISHFVGGGLTAATTYYYTFYGSNELSEIWGDPATTFQSAGPPAVTNSGADAIGVGVATLNGELIVGGGADVYFAWGSADGGTNGGTAAWQQVIPMGSVLQDTPFSNSIAGLYYGQQYHYRILASNSLGQSWSGLDSFWTLPPPGAPVMRVTDQLGMWFDAGVGVTASGGNVTQWSDQSGNGNHATSPSGTPGLVADALNGYPEIQFINEYLNVNTSSYMREQYVVGRSRNVNWNNYGGFLDGKGDNRNYGYLFDNGQKRFHGNQLPDGVSRNGTVLGGQFDMAPINEYMVLKIDMRNVDTGDRQHYVGRSGHSQSSIDILEILAYTNELSAADEAEVGGYLGYKYGIGTTYSYSPASAIVVAPTSASDIEVTTATLGGTLDSTQSVFTVTAFWSTNNNAGSAAWLADGAASSAAAGTFTNVINHSISAAAGSLSGATTYYYTFRASNPQTNVWSTANANFETAGPPSAGLAGGATGIGIGVASLRGEVTAGASANAYICWGATDGGTTSIATWDNAVSMGSIVQGNVFTQALANLYYGIDYQYRVYVTNDAGTAWSAVTNFVTLKPTGSSLAILNWDFETGDLTGWTNVGATAGADTLFRNGYSPVSHSRIGPKQGTYYIDGYSSGQGNSDAWTGIIETEAFTLGADANWTFVSGGGSHSWSGTPAAPGTLAGIALERETSPGVWANAIFQSGANNNSLIARNHDLSAYAGDTMRIRIYDNTTGGWGWCGADDFAVSNVLVGSGVDLSIANTVAANVADVTADLQGTLEATGSVFTVTVYWGTNNNANGPAWLADTSASNAVVAVLTNATGYALNHSLTTLSESTTYYYTYRANNAATNMWASPNITFGTSSGPGAPTAGLAGGVTNIGIATASLRGELQGGVFATTYLCYGASDGGTTSPDNWDKALLVGVVNENEPFTNTLSTLYYGPLYNYRVYVTNSFGSHWSALDTFSTDVPSGDIANTGAANVGETTADLDGTLDGTNAIFTVTAYWSTNNNANGVAWAADGSAFTQVAGTFTNVSDQAISVSVTGLISGASYYYTLLAANAQTNLWATPTLPFGTLSAPVASLGAGAQSSGPSSATLYGLLSLGGVADATLVWGITDGGTGSTNDWQNAIGMGSVNQGVAFSNTISSLYYGIGYNYRVYVTNGAGESWSALDSFFTAAPVDTSVPVKDTLEVHYDANEGVTTSGSTVTDWLDLSGNGRHLGSQNGTPTLLPNTLNGRPVVQFNSGGEQLNMDNPGDEYFARETFMVLRSGSGNTTFGPSWGAPFGAPNGDDNDRTWMMEPNQDRFWGNEIPSAVTHNGTTISSASNFDMGADVSQYMVLKVVSGPNSGTHIRPYVVGTRMDGWADSRYDTAEIIAYSGTTSAGDEDLIGGYLAAKYGITTTYPAYTFGAEQPIVNTTVADLAASTATLTGELDATQSVYTVKVYYGPNDNANGVAWLADGAALSVTVDTLTNVVDYALNVPVTGLTPDATYYYAFLAQNDATNAWATPNESFATFPTLALSNLVATTVTHESATLNARLIVEGTNADVTVYYGTSDGGTTPGSWDTSVFVGTFTNEINTDFSKSVSGLLSDQYYYYAFYASNGAAVAWGSPSEILLTQLHDPQAPVITGATAHFRGANLTWTDNAGSETAYLVRRSSSGSGGPYTQIASLAADTTSYNDTGGSQLSTYWYRIAATSTVTQSSTDFALAQTSVTTPPEPITQLGILNLNVNNGVNPATGEVWAPGDTYRYVFVSSTFADATQVGSSYYDNFVQGLANASALNIGANEGVSWKALASFTTSDARDHTDTNPNTDGSGEGIFMLNGTERIANDYADLWDGSIDTQIDRDENNVAHRTDTSWGGHGSTWTGSGTDGTRSAGNELGSGGNVVFGLASQVNAHWINRGSQADSTVNSLLRGLSEPLTLRALITLENLAVTDVTTNSATLNGNLQVPSTNAYVTLYWGSTDATTNKGSWDYAVDLGNWVLEDSTNLSHALTGMTAGADYYYTFYGSNDVLDVWASPSVFFSPLAAPTLNNNGGATAITAASASLNGLMTAGGTANGTIVWGTSAPAGLNTSVWDFVEVLGTVNQGVGFSTNVSGLSPETTYYYRCYATNALADTWSAITNFTTPRTTHVYIGPNSSNSDQWNVGANWNPNATPLGPVGSVNVEVPVGKLATAWNDSTPAFTGDLTMGVGATVAIGWTTVRPNSYNALGTPGTSTIYMDQGASINVRSGQSPTIPQIQLQGDAFYTMSSSTQPNSSPTYAHGIHGPHTFTLRGKSGCVSTFSASNSFAHFVADPLVGDGFPINANLAGSMGAGDITIQSSSGNTVAGNLIINAADAMSDSGTLSISGSASATKITMNANDTVASVVIDGITQAYGTYGRTGLGGVDFEVSWIAGNGILTIPVPPSGYWDLNGAIAGAGSATPSGTWDAAAANWDSSSDGSGAAKTWTAGEPAVFSAGTDASGTFTVNVSGTRDIAGLTVEEGTVTVSGGTLQISADSPLNVAGGLTTTIDSVVSDDGSYRKLTKTGSGDVSLNGANSFGGIMRIEDGTVTVGAIANAGASSGIGAYPTAGENGLELAGGALEYSGGSATIDRGLTVSGNSTLNLSAAGTALTLGDLQGRDSSGALTLAGGAGSSLSVGRVSVVEGVTLSLAPSTIAMTVASVRGYTSYPIAHSPLVLSGSSDGNSVTGNIYVENPPASGYTRSIRITKSGSGSWSIQGVVTTAESVIVNDGTLTLAGASSYNAATTVNGGTLNVNGSLSSANSITVNSGGALGGTGTIGRSVTVNSGGAVTPGVTTGTLTVNNNVTLAAGGALDIDVSGSGNDKLDVSSTLNITGSTLNVNGSKNGLYVIADYGTLTGTFAAVNGLPTFGEVIYDHNGGTSIAVFVPPLTMFMFR